MGSTDRRIVTICRTIAIGLSRSEDKAQTLQQITQRIEALPDRVARSNVAAATSVLAGLVLEKAIIRQISREEIVQESVIYQDILQQGLQQGLEHEAALMIRLLKRRFGALTAETEAHIRSLSVEQLEALGEVLLDFTQLDELTPWLAHHA